MYPLKSVYPYRDIFCEVERRA